MKALELLNQNLEQIVINRDCLFLYIVNDEAIIAQYDEAIKELESIKNIISTLEDIKASSEYSKYIQAKQALNDVLKGGKDYHSCSFMDISVRDDRFKDRKNKLVTHIGKCILSKIEQLPENIKDKEDIDGTNK